MTTVLRMQQTIHGHGPRSRRWTLSVPAVAVAIALHGSLAVAASSASFQIPNGSVDVAGGRATSASFVLTACVGSEIAGSSASSSFRIDSGCGSGLKATKPGPSSGGGATGPQAVPALSTTAAFILAALLCALALGHVGRFAPPTKRQ